MAFYQWSLTPASNANADTTINWAEGQSPASVNDSSRAEMTRLREWGNDIAGAIVTAGTNVAYTVTSNQGFDTLPHLSGQVIAFTPHATNAATVTLNVDSLGAKPLRISPGVELPSGSIIQGTPYVALYNNTDGAFYLQGGLSNPYSCPLGGGMLYIGPTAPNSAFVFPFGQAISRTTYATLFSLVGTTFGVGDGSTTFNVLDLRGRVPAGVDNMGGSSGGLMPGYNLGVAGGALTETLTTPNLPAYTPSGSVSGSISGTANLSGIYALSPVSNSAGFAITALNSTGGAAPTNPSVSGSFSGSLSGSAQGGSSTPFSLLQPTIACNYILRII